VERYHIKAAALDLASFVVCGAELGGARRSLLLAGAGIASLSRVDRFRRCPQLCKGLPKLGSATRCYLRFYRFVVLALPVLQLA